MSSLGYAWDSITSPYAAYWWAAGILAACVILGTLMWVSLNGALWRHVAALVRFWWCKRMPMTTRSAERAKARATAEEPDPGPDLADDERFAWRRAVAAYFTPTDHPDYADAFEAERPAGCQRLAWRDEVPVWRRAAEGLLGRREPYPVRPGQYNDEPDEEFLP